MKDRIALLEQYATVYAMLGQAMHELDLLLQSPQTAEAEKYTTMRLIDTTLGIKHRLQQIKDAQESAE